MDISIIIPAYNESKKISKDIIAADNFILKNNFVGEIIIVDDGSSDSTVAIAKSFTEKVKAVIKVIALSNNSGKGEAIKAGVTNSNGSIVMYTDVGLTVPFENALIGIELIKNGKCDIVNGSRKLESTIIIKKQKLKRRIISKIFSILFKSILKIPKYMTDTQCGFKIYKGDVARKIFPQLLISGFLFEIEFILLSINSGFKILEIPVTWRCDSDSRLSVTSSSKKIIKDFIFLFKHYRLSNSFSN